MPPAWLFCRSLTYRVTPLMNEPQARPHCAASPAGISSAAVAAAAGSSCRSSLLDLFHLSAPLGQRRRGAELNISRARRLPATFDPPRQPVKHLISELSPCLSSAVFSRSPPPPHLLLRL